MIRNLRFYCVPRIYCKMPNLERHAQMRKIFALAALLIGTRVSTADGNDSEARMRRDVNFLASEQCQGRGVNTAGINLAAEYIANEFQKAGLKPAAEDGSYFQPFTMPASRLQATPVLALRGPQGQQIELKVGLHFQPMGISSSGDVNGSLVFVGYGITAPPSHYDDYQDLDVRGKILVILRDTPRAGNRFASF